MLDLLILKTRDISYQAAAYILPISTQPVHLYISVLKIAVVLGILMMCFVAVDRCLHVLLYGMYKLWFYLRNTSPENNFKWVKLPTIE
eukprot:scaffold657834_cov120-Prasinocladus_malaysianus.AAC.1